jgi:endonuclease-3
MPVTEENLREVLALLRAEYARLRPPLVTEMVERQGRDPFRVLIATILSQRTRDEVTARASAALFREFPYAPGLAGAPLERVEELIRPVGFYRQKARALLQVGRQLVERFAGRVPPDLDLLLGLPGVGRKTANLVLTLGFNLPGICVDTHVHRITNRWGYVRTRTPEETEMALRGKLPAEFWTPINDWLVAWGQAVCHPTSPHCSRCPLAGHCARVGVTRSR